MQFCNVNFFFVCVCEKYSVFLSSSSEHTSKIIHSKCDSSLLPSLSYQGPILLAGCRSRVHFGIVPVRGRQSIDRLEYKPCAWPGAQIWRGKGIGGWDSEIWKLEGTGARGLALGRQRNDRGDELSLLSPLVLTHFPFSDGFKFGDRNIWNAISRLSIVGMQKVNSDWLIIWLGIRRFREFQHDSMSSCGYPFEIAEIRCIASLAGDYIRDELLIFVRVSDLISHLDQLLKVMRQCNVL